MADIKSILDPLNIPDQQKADIWDQFHASKDEADFKSRFKSIDIDDNVKADLWDAKFSGQPRRPGVAPTELPPMERSGLGTAYQAGKEFLTQSIPTFAEGIAATMAPGFDQPGITAIRQLTGEPLDPLKKIVNGILEPIKQHIFMEPDENILQRFVNTASAEIGGDPDRSKQLYDQGDFGGAMAALLGVPAITLGLGKLAGGKITKERTTLPSGKALEASAGLISKGVRQAEQLTSYDIAQIAQPEIQQAYNDLSRPKFPRREGEGLIGSTHESPESKVRTGSKNVLKVVDKAMENVEGRIDNVIKTYSDTKLPGVQKSIMDDLEQEALRNDNLDPPLAAALRDIKTKVQKEGFTVSGLNDIKKLANKKYQATSAQTVGQQIAATAQPVDAYRIAAKSIRDRLYPQIKVLGGPDMSELGRREGVMIQYRNGIHKAYEIADAEQSAWNSNSIFERIAEHTGGSLSNRSILARIGRSVGITLSPMGKFNSLFGRGIGDIGTGFMGEKLVSEIAPNAPRPGVKGLLPPAPGNPSYTFTISGPGAVETLSSTKVIPGAEHMEYIGQRTVPSPTYEPLGPKPPSEGTSRLRQRQQLGVQAELAPESVRGVQTPSKRRMEESFGHAQAAYPERVSTGPETVSKSNWQYIAPEPTPGLPGATGGTTLTTSDPAVVTRTLGNITDQLKNKELPPSVRNALETARNDLANQLDQYYAYSRFEPPPSVRMAIQKSKPGSRLVHPSKTGRTAIVAGTTAAVAGVGRNR